ncbi:Gfo/Idh/MocA family oxidoreductase [Sinomonas sp. ASV322]|uniref:Gfo/Idh/MocA family protein n=1 Tax=Sinomonas sp. ASV322 TaxID=3041920 RepID=UPI0027DDFB41|nr:Gfo/Idh/MocA family oxidoreductase [Sinomonas sp. ASV322]MDQ4501726.1 Gfo/Idh/MocA family oxidoreductase [Sinomonas sp. ASV322]
MTPLRTALIGAGAIGAVHAQRIRASRDAELVGVADPSPASRALADDAGCAWSPDYVELLESHRPEAAIIAVPNALHEDVARECIGRGIPVLLEKPIADSIEAAARIAEASEATGVPVLVGHHRRHSPDMLTARRVVAEGELGRPVTANGMWMAKKPDDYFEAAWRREPGGGLFLINLIHEIDCLRYVFGNVATVQAMASNSVRGFDVEDTLALVLSFENGALATLVMTDSTPASWFWDVASGQGMAFPYEAGNSFWFGGTKASLAVPSMELRWHGPGEDWRDPVLRKTVPIERSDCYANQLRQFIAVARDGAEPLCTAREGLLTLATTIAAREAAETGAGVDVRQLLATVPGKPAV